MESRVAQGYPALAFLKHRPRMVNPEQPNGRLISLQNRPKLECRELFSKNLPQNVLTKNILFIFVPKFSTTNIKSPY